MADAPCNGEFFEVATVANNYVNLLQDWQETNFTNKDTNSQEFLNWLSTLELTTLASYDVNCLTLKGAAYELDIILQPKDEWQVDLKANQVR